MDCPVCKAPGMCICPMPDKAAEKAAPELDVARKLKEALFAIVNHDSKHRTDAYYGGVLVDTAEGPRLAYLRLTFENPATSRQDAGALAARVEELEKQIRDHHSDLPYVMGWNSGFDHAVKELFKLKFPTMLRKMWSGREVQDWIDTETADLRRAASAMKVKS